MMINEIFFSCRSTAWCTPPEIFRKLDKEFHFDLDPAATERSAKCKTFFTEKEDGLKQDWGGHTVFCNPPYGRAIGKWIQKGYWEGRKPGTTVVMLIPARTDTKAWHEYIFGKAAEIRFLRGRLKFTDEEGRVPLDKKGKPQSAPFPSAVVIWRGNKGD